MKSLYVQPTTYVSSGSGVKLDAALRHGDVGSPFGRFSVDTSSIAISIFGPDSGFMVVPFLVLEFTTVWALGQIFSVLKVQRSHRAPIGRQMTYYFEY